MFRRVLAPVVCVATFGIAILVWLDATGNPIAYFSSDVPPGQTFYVFSKLCALIAIVMLWFQSMAALAKTTPALRGFPILRGRAHAGFGIATVLVIVAHLSLFIAASTLRTGHLPLDLLVPAIDQGYFRTMVGLGAIAFWLLVLAVIAGWIRYRGTWAARWVHRLVFAVIGIGFVHGLTVGSETRFGLMKYVYAFIGLSLGTALLSWVWQGLRRARAAGVSPPAVIAETARTE
jgi:hypothetical protein